MPKRLQLHFLLFLLAGYSSALFAQTTENGLLWEISGNGLKKPSYLYGTIHIQAEPVFSYGPVVEEKIRNCEGFAMEVILDQINPMSAAQAMIMQETTLDKLLKPEEYQKVDSYLKSKTGMGLAMFNTAKPFFISSQLMLAGMPADRSQPLDMHLLKIARDAGKVTSSIESFEEQMAAINSLSLQDQATMLVKLVEDTLMLKSQFTDLLQSYLMQDIDKMVQLGNDPTMPEEFSRVFLVERNVKMAATIEKLMKERSTFSAVGAAHLGGSDGILQALRNMGYEVKPVAFSFSSR